MNYHDDHVCPPMIERRRQREQRDATIARKRAERTQAPERAEQPATGGAG